MKHKQYFLLILFILTFSFSNAQVRSFTLPPHVADNDYIPGQVIIKIKPAFRSHCSENIIDIPKLSVALNAINATQVVKMFKGKKPPEKLLNQYGEKMVDLSLIYELKYSATVSIEKAINGLLATGTLEYAEPHYLPHPFGYYIPNDYYADSTLGANGQWHLKKIRAYQAWDIQKGDTNIVIGIIDSGTDTLHPDLNPNVKRNYADPVNGVDDDGDGFLDNYYGWDWADNDNKPQYDALGHGVFVAGLSSAVTDNGIGVAGTGFRCKFLPVKVTDNTGNYTMGYQGIVYAVDHGCSIVNCSWGGYGGAGQFGQDIVDYATNNMNALVVAASGNNDNDYPVYPAAYNNVLSVTATDIHDHKWVDTTNGTGSTWGNTVGISAPGAKVWSTWVNQVYQQSTGTSFSAPIVAGAAGIVKAQYPTFSAMQIAAKLQSTADNIDTIPFNAPYAGLMGTGRLNMFKAVTNQNSPWIKMTSDSIADHNDGVFIPGDTLFISGVYKNYLDPSTAGLTAVISTTSPYVTISKSTVNLGQINTLASRNNYIIPFKAEILSGVPVSTQINFKITFTDAALNYTSSQYFSVIVNKDYLDIDTNKLKTTMTSKGRIGYNDMPGLTQGIGVTYNNSASYLSCGGFMVGNSNYQVSDDIYGQVLGNFDNDFATVQVVHKIIPPVVSDFDAECVFNDNNAGVNKMNLTITNNGYAWDTATRSKFVILDYSIKNNGTVGLSSLYAGLFMDYDISTGGLKDRIDFDPLNNMSYTYSSQGGPYLGIELLSASPLHHYAIDLAGNSNGTTTSINLLNGFSDYYKYYTLRTPINRNIAGYFNGGDDVADVLSTGPFVLLPGDSVKVSFALIGGDNLGDLQASAVAANRIYNHVGITENTMGNLIQVSDVYPNPSNGSFSFNVHLPNSSDVVLNLINAEGKEIQAIHSGTMGQGDHPFTVKTDNFAAGIYYLRLTCGKTIITKDVTIIK